MSKSTWMTTCLALAGLVAGAYAEELYADTLFFDDFENRTANQATIGNNWTWYEQTWSGNACSGDPSSNFGPYDTAEDDYVAANRNYWTADVANGGDGNYFRAGLEVPAWEGAFSNMLRVYGNVYNKAPTCQRILIFQEMTIEKAGWFAFSYDVVKDVVGDLDNGGYRAGFVKILDPNNGYQTVLFEIVDTEPPETGLATRTLKFEIPETYLGMLFQFGFYTDHTPSLGQTYDKSGAFYDNVRLETLDIGPGHSGSFYNTAQSGHGFSVEFGWDDFGNPLALVYWYLFDDLGDNVFLLGIGTPEGNHVSLEFYSVLGMKYGQWDPGTKTEEVAGTGDLTFSDAHHAVFNYLPNAYAATHFGHSAPVANLPLVRLFGVPAYDTFRQAGQP